MLEPVVAYVTGLPSQDLSSLQLEEMACCVAWLDSGPDGVSEERRRRLDEAIPQWAAVTTPPAVPTEGRHQQPLLRLLIEALGSGGIDALTPDEVCFLCAAVRLAEAVQSRGLLQRPYGLLAPHARDLLDKRRSVPPRPGLPGLADRIRFTTAAELLEARQREIKSFAGIAMSFVAPTFTHTGTLKVLGNIPERCAVVVDQGSCHVAGFVLGRVAATRDVEVQDNVSGTVVVRQGNVRARNLVDGALVVAKTAGVYCRRSQGPRLVFGGARITVNGDVVMGRHMAPAIRVQGEVSGGEFVATRSVEAGLFRNAENRPVFVRLRQGLSPRDYGESIPADAQKLLARAVSIRYRMRQLQSMAALAESEANEAAQSAILFLCLDEGAQDRLRELEAKQRRLGHVRRMVAAAQAVHDRTGSAEHDHALYTSARQGLEEITDESQENSDLLQARNDLLDLWRDLLERERQTGLSSQTLDRLRECLAEWLREERALTQDIENRSAAIRRLTEGREVLQRLGAQQAPVQLLRRLLSTITTRGATSDAASRLETPFARLLLRVVRARLDRAAAHQAAVADQAASLNTLSETLQREYQVMLPADAEAPHADTRVSGRFEAGVRIGIDPESPEAASDGDLVVTEDSFGATVAYRRRDGCVVFEGSGAPSNLQDIAP